MITVILSGGSGTRLWPLSRKAYPKQFLSLAGPMTMLQDTVERAQKVTGNHSPIVVCNEEHRFLVAEQLRENKVIPNGILLEPEAKNTAPAIAAAASHVAHLQQQEDINEDTLMLVMPADHVIKNVAAFKQAVETATEAAKSGKLVTFGVVPTAPETGYGYIRAGRDVGANVYCVEEFVEKPDLETARRYLASGNYYWNSGMFLFNALTFLAELEKFNPDIVSAVQRSYRQSERDLDFIRLDKKSFSHCPADSIDYAVMEKSSEVVTVPLQSDWNDIGSWSALWDIAEKDESGNSLVGDVINQDSTNCYLHSKDKLMAAVGLNGIIAVETDDAVLIAAKDQVQKVKQVVSRLQKGQRGESNNHRKVYRPWGYYDSVDVGERFQVKRIVVDPGQKLSLQMHHHRAEHWVVVKGTAKVTRGDEIFLVSENESTYIPLGVNHRLENPGSIDLEMIEIQSGSYLGEDDIVRFDDSYGRP